jgi:hypothetical protein
MIADLRKEPNAEMAMTTCIALHGRLMATLLRCAESESGFGYPRIRSELKRCGVGCVPRTQLKTIWDAMISIRDHGYNPPPGDEITVVRDPKRDTFIPRDGLHRIALLHCLDRPIPAIIGD